MHLKSVLKLTVAAILQRHVAAAVEEIAATMTDEIDALACDRLADLRTQLEFAGKEGITADAEQQASDDAQTLDHIEQQVLQRRQQDDDAYLAALCERAEPQDQ
jgi:hypothetical protein